MVPRSGRPSSASPSGRSRPTCLVAEDHGLRVPARSWVAAPALAGGSSGFDPLPTRLISSSRVADGWSRSTERHGAGDPALACRVRPALRSLHWLMCPMTCRNRFKRPYRKAFSRKTLVSREGGGALNCVMREIRCHLLVAAKAPSWLRDEAARRDDLGSDRCQIDRGHHRGSLERGRAPGPVRETHPIEEGGPDSVKEGASLHPKPCQGGRL
jgi:hypothetical protein